MFELCYLEAEVWRQNFEGCFLGASCVVYILRDDDGSGAACESEGEFQGQGS